MTRAHAEMLPAIRASNEAWRQEHSQRLRDLDRQRAERRELATQAIRRGLLAIDATDDERAAVASLTGVFA